MSSSALASGPAPDDSALRPAPDDYASRPAPDHPASRPSSRPATKSAADLLTDAQLDQPEQALGWWLGGAGAIGLAAGAFALYLADASPPGRTRDLEYATGVAFAGLGAAVLVAGIYTMAAKDPGPCETDGTALQGAVVVTPLGVRGRF